MKDRIILQGLKFRGCHGVGRQERVVPQEFEIDLVLFMDLSPAGRSDSLEDTVDYGSVYHRVKEVVEHQSCRLIEALAEAIARAVLSFPPVESVQVTVKKLHPPLEGEYRYFAVEIQRSR